MSKLGRLWDWLLPGLICLDPMVAMAYYEATEGEASQDGSVSVRGRGLVSNAPTGWVLIEMVDVPQPALLGP